MTNWTDDISYFVNVLFDSCSFPLLEKLTTGLRGVLDEEGDLSVPTWDIAPNSRTLIEQFPLLKNIHLNRISMSLDVADYFGALRRKTKCCIHIADCDFDDRDLAPKRELLLDSLELSFEKWSEFCQQSVSKECFNDLEYWNTMTDDQFKRIAYAAALQASVWDSKTLDTFLTLCKADSGCALTADMLKSLKEYSVGLSNSVRIQQELNSMAGKC